GCMLLNTTLDLATPPQANANGPTLPSPGGLPVVGPTVQQVEGQLALPLNTVDGVYSSVKPIAASLAGYGVDYAAYTAGETVGKGPGAAGLQSVPLPGPQWDNHPC
ncbi:MAG TPA: hypothetical protein VG245_11450, partial [Candidatus Dormibacteraeota bacterium]|nr:hypothetical protein [Candidatus Dormibacteraeota bacterium]